MERVSFSDWQKLDFRTGTIESVEEIPGKDKLYKLLVDIGTEKRVIVAGIKQMYSADELLGKQVVLFANLEPKKLGGIESNGMLLAADEEGRPVFLTPERTTKNGLQVR